MNRSLSLLFSLLLVASPALSCTLSVSISSPPNNTTYTTAQTVTITATATNTFSVSKVEFYDGGVLKGSDTTSPYSFGWVITSADNGVHSWTARAYDTNFDVTTSDPISLTVNIVSVGGGSLVWDTIMAGSASSSSIAPHGVAVDPSGNFVTTGSFQGTIDFGGGTMLTSAGSDEIYLAKYSPTGVLTWAERFGSTGSDAGWGVTTNAAGEILVTGAFQGTVDFGNGAITSSGGNDIFVAKYSTAGVLQWVQKYGSTLADLGYNIKMDASSNIFVTGYFNGTVNFGTGAIVSNGAADFFVLKLTTAGATTWAKGVGGTQADIGRAVAVDSQGNAIVGGYFKGAVDFGGGALTSAGGNDAFLAKYAAANGAFMWAQRFGGTIDDRTADVAIGSSDSIIFTGTFGDLIDFGGGNLPNTGGGGDIFLTKFTSAGTLTWAKGFGTGLASYGEVANAVFVDTSDNVALTGGIIGSVDFGGGALVSNGTYDVFLAKFNGAGTHQWSKRFPGSFDDFGVSMAIVGNGPVNLLGYFPGTIDLGGGVISNVGGQFSPDGFLAQFTQ